MKIHSAVLELLHADRWSDKRKNKRNAIRAFLKLSFAERLKIYRVFVSENSEGSGVEPGGRNSCIPVAGFRVPWTECFWALLLLNSQLVCPLYIKFLAVKYPHLRSPYFALCIYIGRGFCYFELDSRNVFSLSAGGNNIARLRGIEIEEWLKEDYCYH